MKAEDYVSYEVAKLLKEKGYDEYTELSYFTKNEDAFNYKEGELTTGRHIVDRECITVFAPTLCDAQKWLREVQRIEVSSNYDYEKSKWFFFYCSMDCSYSFDAQVVISDSEYNSYEESLGNGIKNALKLI